MVKIASAETATLFAAMVPCILAVCTDSASLDRNRAPDIYAQVM